MFIEGYINFETYVNEPNISLILENFISFNEGWIKYETSHSNRSRTIAIAINNILDKPLLINSPNGLSICELDDKDFPELKLSEDQLNSIGIGIWYNRDTKRLILYRHLFGEVPLFYLHITGKFIAFSSSLPSLIKMQLVKPHLTINESEIFDYSIYAADSKHHYNGNTFYNGIESMLPGHLASISPSSMISHPGFQIDLLKWNHIDKLQQYGEVFKELFGRSIHRIAYDESQLIASQLSGGLDSSSISGMLRYLYPKRTLNTLFGSTQSSANEKHYSDIVAKQINSRHHIVNPVLNQLATLYSHTLLHGQPERYLSGSFFQSALMKQVNRIDGKIMLTGHPGDQIVDNGFSLLFNAFKNKEWKTLNDLLNQRSYFASLTSDFADWDSLSTAEKQFLFKQHYLFKQMMTKLKTTSIRSSILLYRELQVNFGVSLSYFLKNITAILINKLSKNNKAYISILNADFANQFQQKKSKKTLSPYSGLHNLWADAIHTTQGVGITEELFTLSNHYGISTRFPFYDKDLYEFSLTVPASIKFGNGIGRGHLREAMKNIIPEEVRLRKDKTEFGLYGREVSLRSYSQAKELLQGSSDIWQYIDKKKFHNAISNIKLEHGKNTTNSLLINRAIALAVWLDLKKKGNYD